MDRPDAGFLRRRAGNAALQAEKGGGREIRLIDKTKPAKAPAGGLRAKPIARPGAAGIFSRRDIPSILWWIPKDKQSRLTRRRNQIQAKRKLAALLLSLCMVLGMLPMTVFAAGETTAEGLVYEVNGESVTITGYTGNEASVVIPNEIEGKPVTAIGKAAFFNCGNLTSIEIPEGIESIGVQAFQLCKKLESVKIPASVISIEERAFQSCSNLDSVTFAEGSRLETINNFAFNDCGKLTSIEFPSIISPRISC